MIPKEPDPLPPAITKLKLPPTLIIIGIILFLASAASVMIPPGAYDRESREIIAPGVRYTEVVAAPGDTVESILAREHATQAALLNKKTGTPLPAIEGIHRELIADYPVLQMAKDVAVSTVSTSDTIRIPLINTRTRDVVIRGTYHEVAHQGDSTFLEATWTTISRFFNGPMVGFKTRVETIGFVLLLGGAFGVILATGAIDSGLRVSVDTMERLKIGWAIIPVLMTLFSIAGATIGMSEEVIPFVLITIPLAMRLGYDSLTGLCISFVAAGIGFAAALTNPFTIGIAQGIAGLPPFSGMGFRFLIWVLATAIGIIWTVRWANKVRRDPKCSPVYESDKELVHTFEAADHKAHRFGLREGLVILITAGTIWAGGHGVTHWDWWLGEMTAVFIAGAVLSALVMGMNADKATKAFAEGASQLTGACMIIAVSAAILEVLKQGNTLDTLLYYIDTNLGDTPGSLGACLMFAFHTVLNFFIPSGSAQAAVTMPLMTPLADLMGISRQTAVLAFQFGDGFCNMIIPTSAVTMSVLGLARLPWEKWARWIAPLVAILTVFGFIMLTIAVNIGYE